MEDILSNPIELIQAIEKLKQPELCKFISDLTSLNPHEKCTWDKEEYKSIEAMFKFLSLLDNYFEDKNEIFKLLNFKITGITSRAKEKGLLAKILKNYKENVTSDIADDLKENKPESIKELIKYMIDNYEDIWDISKYTFDIIYPKAKFENIPISNESIFNNDELCNIGSPSISKKWGESGSESDNESDHESDNESEHESDNESDHESGNKSDNESGNESDHESDNESDHESDNESDNDDSDNDNNSEQEETKSNASNDESEFNIKNSNFITAIKLFILTKNENIVNIDETDFMN